MVQKKPLFLELVLVGLLITVVLSNLAIEIVAGISGNSETPESVEITEYEGKDLSSIDDFYENSIEGPRYMDNETYRLVITGLIDDPFEYTYGDVINNNLYLLKRQSTTSHNYHTEMESTFYEPNSHLCFV